jgi:DNA polymerase III subunit gamma/tau
MSTGPLELARKYRPATFGDVSGQKPVTAILYRMAKLGTVPSALLFHGERGCGKTSMARILAAALNCEEEASSARTWPCGRCASCEAVAAGISPDVEEVDAASNGSVDKIREVRERANYGSSGRRKVYIIDEAHAMSTAAFNALLKTLEEPLENVVFILITTQPGSILATVVSRCSPFWFRPMTVAAIRDRLAYICQSEELDVESGLLDAIAEGARGGMRDAVMKLDQVAAVGALTLDLWRELTGEADFTTALLTAAADGDHQALFAALDGALAANGDCSHVTRQVVWCLRDLLVLSAGGQVAAQGEALRVRQGLATRLGAPRVASALAVLWDLQARVRVEDREVGLTLAVVMVSRRLCPKPEEAPSIAMGGPAHAGIADIRSIMGAT